MTSLEMCNTCIHHYYCAVAYKKDHWCGNHVFPIEMKGVTNNMQKSEIFKVQKPMSPGGGPVLIYNKSRSIFSQIAMTQEIAKYMGTEYKIYVKGYVDSDGLLQIEEKVPAQRW